MNLALAAYVNTLRISARPASLEQLSPASADLDKNGRGVDSAGGEGAGSQRSDGEKRKLGAPGAAVQPSMLARMLAASNSSGSAKRLHQDALIRAALTPSTLPAHADSDGAAVETLSSLRAYSALVTLTDGPSNGVERAHRQREMIEAARQSAANSGRRVSMLI